jgi:type I restriction enzyme M protein
MTVEKSKLYSSLWASCDELRGGMDASRYNDYILTLLLMKYVSDKYRGIFYGGVDVPNGTCFDDMPGLIGNKSTGEEINKIIAKLVAHVGRR